MGDVGDERARGLQKSYFDVLGICCPSEVPLVEKVLKPLDGVYKVSVMVPSKTVIVEHDPHLITQLQIVKALNQARLEATVRSYGTDKIINKWPSPYILACGVLLVVSLFQRFFHPLRWVALAAVAIGLPPIVLRSIAAIRRYTLDINILMLIAVAGAVALRDYSEAGFIVFLFTIAEWLETMASHKATAGMSALMSMAPQKAILAESGQVIDARDVKVNTILAVKAGEVIPIDGIVVEGKSEVNEQSLTGESFPVAKQAESLVWAGTLNIDGYISMKTTALAEDSAVAKMARLVEEAQNSRSKTQRLIDSCAKYYTPAAVVIAGGVAIIPLALRLHNPKHWFQLALVLLVSACPCALVLSTPVATFCSLLKAANIGLLVKGGDVLEALARVKVVAFDKTGTITKGEFSVMDLRPVGCQVDMDTLLYWISSIESKSSHPMASALVDYARSKSIEPKSDDVSEFQIYPGEGVYGEIEGKNIYIGNKRIAARAGCDSVPNPEGGGEAVTLGYVFLGPALIGIFTLSDSCRTGAAEAIRQLKSLGIKVAMLTGDSTAAAMHAQNQLGHAIEVLHAELLPEDKVQIINDLKTKEGAIAMVGDGMNDAPALAAADVGISMGISGSAVAMETSHITLMSNDILKIPKAIQLARRTHKKIIANIVFSVVTKMAIVGLAIAGYPLLWAAVLADVGTCLVVILNSMMLLHTRTPKANKKCCRTSQASNVHKHAARCSTGDDCCQKRECTNTVALNPMHCGAAHCGDGAHEEHTHRYAHDDQCTRKACQTQDEVLCCGETGRHTASMDCEHIAATGCRMQHRGEVEHGGSGSGCHDNCHGDDDHSECTAEDHCNAAHIKQLTDVHCCDGDDMKNIVHGLHSQCGIENHRDVMRAQEPTQCQKKSYGHGAHSQCETEHHEDAAHGQLSVECCVEAKCSSCIPAPNMSHEHVVIIETEAEHHTEHADEKQCSQGSETSNRCNGHAIKKEIGGCCKTERKECKKMACCSSSLSSQEKKGIDHNHMNEREECVKGACCSSSVQGGLKRENTCCSSTLQGGLSSGIPAPNMGHEHVIIIETKAEHHTEHAAEKLYHQGSETSNHCSGHAIKKEIGGCCKTERKECKKTACCSSSQSGQEKKGIDQNHMNEIKECVKEACCSSMQGGHERKSACCSSSLQGGTRRESGSCCRSYRKECEQKRSCCGGRLGHLPEIIIE